MFLRANQIPGVPLELDLEPTSEVYTVLSPLFSREIVEIERSPLGSHFVIGFKCIEGPWGRASGFKAVGKGGEKKRPLSKRPLSR